MTNKLLRVVIYTRVSTEEQAQSGTSLATQEAICLDKAARMGAFVVGRFSDEGVSGALYQTRPGLQSAIRCIETGEADVFLCANISRLSRDGEHQSAIKKRIERTGGRIVFAEMEVADTPEGGLTFGIFGTFAEYERKLIRERTMRGKRRRAEEGIQPARGFQVYGYHIVSTGDVLTGRYPAEMLGKYLRNEEEAQWVEEMYRRAYRGDSLRSIARYLTDNGVPTARGGQVWYPSTILFVLRNPVHKGQPFYGTTERHVDESRRERGLRADYSRPAPPEKWIPLSAPPIVDEATWDAVQRRLIQNKERKSGNPKRKYPLSGIVRCELCGRGMIGTTVKGAKEYTYYVCGKAVSGNDPRNGLCKREFHKTGRINGLLSNACTTIFSDPSRLSAAIEAEQQRIREEAHGTDAERLKSELVSLEREERAAVEAQIAGVRAGANPALYLEVFERIAARRKRLESQLAKYETLCSTLGRDSHHAPPSSDELARSVGEKIARIPEIINHPILPATDKHDFVAQFIERIVPDQEGCTIDLRPELLPSDDPQTVQHIRVP
jgi:site-specific DNA recombinase